MYSMQIEGILNSTTTSFSFVFLDDNVPAVVYASNTFFLSFQLNEDEKSRFPVWCDIVICCPAFAIIRSSLWLFGRTDIRFLLRFIFSFLLFELRKYKFWRHMLYIFVTVIHALMLTYMFCVFCSNRVDFFSCCKEEQSRFFDNMDLMNLYLVV